MERVDDIAKVSRTLIGMDVKHRVRDFIQSPIIEASDDRLGQRKLGREHVDPWLAERQRSEDAEVTQ